MPSQALINVQQRMSDHMDGILRLFKSGAKITVIVRNPEHGDADVILGNDDLDDAIAAINHLKAKEPTFKQGNPMPVGD